jgi:hypothetical protein
MTVPRRFVGAWRRERLEVDGRGIARTGSAVWVEAGGTYVDVRGPGGLASNTSFGGRSTWRSPLFTWHHDIDLAPESTKLDRGELTIDGDRIVERGVGLTGDGVPYVEYWRRLPIGDDVKAIARHAQGLAVRVGDYAAALSADPPSACCWQRSECDRGTWSVRIALGPECALPLPVRDGWNLPRGWTVTLTT